MRSGKYHNLEGGEERDKAERERGWYDEEGYKDTKADEGISKRGGGIREMKGTEWKEGGEGVEYKPKHQTCSKRKEGENTQHPKALATAKNSLS